MDSSFLVQGFVIGLSIAIPVGPIGVLCIQRTLTQGRAVGFISGLGAATADALYGLVAGLGLTLISTVLVDQQAWLRLVGGGFLCYLGFRTFLAEPAHEGEASLAPANRARGRALFNAYGSTFFLTLTNPVTILSFVAVFAGLGLGATGGDYGAAAWLVLGVFCGSATWWLILSGGVGLLRARVTPRRRRWLNRLSGVILVGFGLVALASLLVG